MLIHFDTTNEKRAMSLCGKFLLLFPGLETISMNFKTFPDLEMFIQFVMTFPGIPRP